jgi:hypothetical protein
MAQQIQVRRGLKQDLPTLADGEFGLAQDTNELFIGGPAGNIGIAKASDLEKVVSDIDKYKTDLNTYTDAIELAIADSVKTIFFPSGDYPITRPIRITKDNSFVLSKGARIYADAPMVYMFDFNTDRPITSIYDLSKDCFITGGTLDGNGLADDILRLNKFLHFTLDNVEFKNGLKRGLVTNDTAGMAAELIARNLHFINTINTNILDNKAIVNLGTDNHFENIVTIDWTVGVYDKGHGIFDKVHYWISHKERIENSIAFEIDSHTSLNQCFADTARTAFKCTSGNARIFMSKVYYNLAVYDTTYATSFPPKIIERLNSSTIKFVGNRVIANGITGGATLIDVAHIAALNSLNNIFEGTVNNSFSAMWDVPNMAGAFLYNGSTHKGTLATSSTSVQLINQATGKVVRLGDDGTLLYDGLHVQRGLSGLTAERPTGNRFTGMLYYDTTLGKPIWWNGSVWKDSAGTTV